VKQVSAKVTGNNVICGPQAARFGGRAVSSSRILWLECPEIAREAGPGQFVMVRCGEELVLCRPLSIHQVNNDSIALFFAVWEEGKGTGWLSQRHVGDTVELFGPLGNGFSIYPGSRKLLLLAGGIGIAPLRFLADKALDTGKEVTLLEGAGTADQLYPTELLPVGTRVITATEDGTSGQTGRITELLPDYAKGAEQIFACGPLGMYRTLAAQSGTILSGKPVQVSLEVRMGCGLGMCYACTIKTKKGLKQVCRDGPVFALDDILWDEIVC